MTIDPVVRGVCESFASSDALMELVQSMVVAEGGQDAFVRAVQCSEPSVQTFDAAVRVACRTVFHRVMDYVKDNCGRSFVLDLGGFWAPMGASNDPTNLNANWPKNVSALWLT